MRRNLSAGIFFLVLSLLLIFSWFRFGLIFGGGDVGLQTYDPIRVIERAVFVWWDSLAPGTTIPQGLTAVPFQSLLSLAQLVGFSKVLIQALFFLIILFFMGFGMYLFLSRSFRLDFRYTILGGIFYMFNPYMMIQIWHRFVHSSFFLVAALPFLILFWSDWIKNKKLGSLLLFLLTNLIASYLYGTIAYIVTVWLILFLVALAEAVFPWEGFKKSSQYIGRFLIGLIIWILTNLWWLMPVTTTTPVLLSQQHSQGESLVTLINISRQAILPYSLQMINPFYLFFQEDFGKFYLNPLVRLLPWILVGIILTGFINSLKKKEYVKWAFIFLMVLFLAKGSSPPFGYSFILGFEHFFPLGVLRNPFEKMGILLPFVGAILFTLGLKTIYEFLHKKKDIYYSYGLFALTILIIIAFNWRMFTPDLFGKIGKPAYVKVPTSYNQANDWIKEDVQGKANQGKILHLPLTRGEDVNYKWEYGYSGIEPSDLFFTALPSISRGFNLARVDDSLAALYYSFHKFSDDPDKILRILQDFNVHYIVLHKDVNWLGGELFNPLLSEKILDQLYFLRQTQEFGALKIYKLSNEYFKSEIYISSEFQLIYPSNQSLVWPYLLGNEELMITPLNQDPIKELLAKSTQETIFPRSSFVYPSKNFILAVINMLSSDESGINLLLSQLTNKIPILEQNGEIEALKLNEKLIGSTKEITSLFRDLIATKGMSKQSLGGYQSHLEDILSNDFRNSRLLTYVGELDMSLIFQVHLILLELFEEKTDPSLKDDLVNMHAKLKDWMIKKDFTSKNFLNVSEKVDPDQTGLIDREKSFRFNIPGDGKYEILLLNTYDKEIFEGNLGKIRVSINGQDVELLGTDLGEIIFYGARDFKSGDLEIVTNMISSQNLIQPFEEMVKFGNVTKVDDSIKVEPLGQYGYFESLIPNAKGGNVYKISFEIQGEDTNGFYFQHAQDIDNVNENGQKINQLNEFVELTPGNWQSRQFFLLPLKLATQQAAIRFLVTSNGQLPPPAITIRNLRIEKVLNNDFVLRQTFNSNQISDEGQVLNIEKINPTLYKGSIKLNSPSILVFSETYHPGWKLKLTNGKNTYSPQKHVMANLYGNGWYIGDTGSFNFILEFEPQKYVYLGVVVAVFTYLTLLILIGWRKIKK